MNVFRSQLTTLLVLLLLAGCASNYDAENTDPTQQLKLAQFMFEVKGRPQLAEGKIVRVIEIYKSQSNELELAEAYRIYGLFLKSEAVRKSRDFYLAKGFEDKTTSYYFRYEKALEYFDKSRELLQKNSDIQWITNVYLQMAFTHELMHNKVEACNAYDLSLNSNREVTKNNPDRIILVPKEFPSFEAGISEFKRRLNCPA